MNDERADELMQLALDGAASSEEIAELNTWMAGSAERRSRFQHLTFLFEAMDGMPAAEPPVDLAPAVGRAIRAGLPQKERRGWLRTWWAGRRITPGYAYAFSTGLVLGGAILGLALRRSPGNWDSTSGAMVPLHGRPVVAGTKDLAFPGGRAHLEIEAQGGLGKLHLDLESAGPVSVNVDWNRPAAELLGLEQSTPATMVQVDAAGVAIEHQGTGRYGIVVARGADSPLIWSVTVRTAQGNWHETMTLDPKAP